MISWEFSHNDTFGWPRKSGKLPMDMVSKILLKVKRVFSDEYLDKLAYETDFIKRRRKVSPRSFLEKLIFLRLEHPNNTLEDLAYEFRKENTKLTKQALHKKCNASAVKFVYSVFQELLLQPFKKQQFLEAFPFINEVHVIDSSEIKLNKALSNISPQIRNQGAALKLQSLINIVNNQVLSLDIQPSKKPDQSYKQHLKNLQPGNLLLSDLGYFCVESFKKIEEKGAFFLSRYFKNTNYTLLKMTINLIYLPT